MPWQAFKHTRLALAMGVCLGQAQARADETALEFDIQGRWLVSTSWLAPQTGIYNPENNILRTPDGMLLTQLRPDFRLDLGRVVTMVGRPRARLQLETMQASQTREAAHDFEVYASSLYLMLTFSEQVQLTWGLQNFQWGPARALSPSNRLFLEYVSQPDPMHEYRGHHLVRLNVAIGETWSLVLIGEPSPGYAALDRPDFRPKAAMKLEARSRDGGYYSGLVAGSGGQTWLGVYGALQLGDAWSVYGDTAVVFSPPASAWRLVSQRPAPEVASHTVLGADFTTAANYIFRAEIIYLSDGLSSHEAEQAQSMLIWMPTALRQAAALQPFPAQLYVYASATPPLLGATETWRLDLRYVGAPGDRSGVILGVAEWAAADAWTLYGTLAVAHGGPDADLSRTAGMAGMLGVVWSL